MNARFLLVFFFLGLCGCSSIYYGTMEKFGMHKRDILVNRVEEARDAQAETRKQFQGAMEQFKRVVHFQGGDLEAEYDKLRATLAKSETDATAVREHIGEVEDVSDALFDEWRSELKQYDSETLRRASQQKYDLTKRKCDALVAAMKKAEARLEPALVPLRDQVLFMKHNLNAKAIAGLGQEVAGVQANVDQLVSDMAAAIAQADAFLATLKEGD